MRIGLIFVLCLVVVCASSCVPYIANYYIPDGYDAEDTEWVCFRTNRPICRMNLSDNIDLAISTIDSGSTTFVYIVVVADRETAISVSKNEASVQPEGGEAFGVRLVTQSWNSKHQKEMYGEHFQYFTFQSALADTPSFLLALPVMQVDVRSVHVDPIRMISKPRVELDFPLLVAPW